MKPHNWKKINKNVRANREIDIAETNIFHPVTPKWGGAGKSAKARYKLIRSIVSKEGGYTPRTAKFVRFLRWIEANKLTIKRKLKKPKSKA
ncbi:MAG: hypothetical protein WCW44_05810 [archaeon]|jgi:hypothetical protein